MVGPQARRPHQIFVPLVWAQCASNLRRAPRDPLISLAPLASSSSRSFAIFFNREHRALCSRGPLFHSLLSSLCFSLAFSVSFPPFLSPLSLSLSLYLSVSLSLILRQAVEESSTQPLRGAPRRSRVSARAFRLAVQRTLSELILASFVTETFYRVYDAVDLFLRSEGIGRSKRDIGHSNESRARTLR